MHKLQFFMLNPSTPTHQFISWLTLWLFSFSSSLSFLQISSYRLHTQHNTIIVQISFILNLQWKNQGKTNENRCSSEWRRRRREERIQNSLHAQAICFSTFHIMAIKKIGKNGKIQNGKLCGEWVIGWGKKDIFSFNEMSVDRLCLCWCMKTVFLQRNFLYFSCHSIFHSISIQCKYN